jgi:hypothetical protein
VDYSNKKGAVDWTNTLLSYVWYIRKYGKWHKKFTLDAALHNVHALYLKQKETSILCPNENHQRAYGKTHGWSMFK